MIVVVIGYVDVIVVDDVIVDLFTVIVVFAYYCELPAYIYLPYRSNLIRNIFTQYLKTGYLWEQYDDRTGSGKVNR